MSLVTRNINNSGEPLCAPDGTVLAGVTITFTLTNLQGLPVDVWDGHTYERVVGLKVVTTDTNGLFSVDLWPNDRGNAVTQYRCQVASPYVQDFYASLPSAGLIPISWVDFMGGALPLPPVPLDALAMHEADPNGHPVATESVNGFMSAADKLKLDLLPGGGSTGLAFTATAGQNLSGNTAVVINANGLAFYADRSTADNMFRIAGVTQGAAANGAAVSILSHGLMTDSGWAWTAGLPIFLGHGGALTQTPPSSGDGFLIVIGSALSATSIFINPSLPIVII